MRRAIIDNSTLTAVQRLTGKIPVCNKYSLDGDILAFETLIQTILFFDEIYYVNDYKKKFCEERSKEFYYLNSIVLEKRNYDMILKITNNLTKDIIPIVKNGTFEDDNFKPFFELLKMNNIFTWDMSSSVYYLTQKMLDGVGNELNIDDYNKVNQMIFSEYNDEFEKVYSPKKKILDARGNEISSKEYIIIDKQGEEKTSYIGKQTSLFLANLSWLAYRTIFYTLLVNSLGGTLVMHPIRDAFQISYLNRINTGFNSIYRNIKLAINTSAENRIKSIYQYTEPLVSKYVLPLFSIALVNKAGTATEAINMALHMRCEGEFVLARGKLKEIEDLFKENEVGKALKKANKLVCDVDKIMYRLGEKYYVNTPQGISLSPIIQVWNIGTSIARSSIPKIPEFTPKIRCLDKLKDLVPQHGFNAIYKSLINDLSSIAKIGKYYEMLTSEVEYDENADYYSAKVEEEKYKNTKSYWKIPM